MLLNVLMFFGVKIEQPYSISKTNIYIIKTQANNTQTETRKHSFFSSLKPVKELYGHNTETIVSKKHKSIKNRSHDKSIIMCNQ